MKPVYDATYWMSKQERKRLQTPKPDRENLFNRIMATFFARSEEEKIIHKKHTRTIKERRMRRMKHRDRMRNAA